jgi:general secretion pathway protein F
MTVFNYVCVDANGGRHQGVLEGGSSNQVREQLHAMDLIPIEISEAVKKIQTDRYVSARKYKISSSELSLITYQLSILLSAGLQLEAALLSIVEQIEKKQLKTIISEIRLFVLEGNSLANGLDAFPDQFPKLYRATISAGEQSGQLEAVMIRLAAYLDQQQAIRNKIQQAMIYPGLLTVVSLIIITFLLTYAMPKITAVFNESGQTLPEITIILLALSEAIKSYGLYVLLILICVIIGFIKMLKQHGFRYRTHQFLLKIPLLNKTIIIINTARFSRTLGILFTASVQVLEAMQIANSVITLLPMHEAVSQAIIRVGEGMSIHQALLQTGYFSKLSTQLMASGETSGKLEMMLEKSADFQEQYLVRWMNTVLSLFEPIMILLMGIFVLFIALAILLPIFEMNQFSS